MQSGKITNTLRAIGLLSLVSAGSYVWAQQTPGIGPRQGPGFGPMGGFDQTQNDEPLPPSKVTIEERDGYRYITSNGIPNHTTGKFPNPGNPNSIRAQNYKFRFPLKPVAATKPVSFGHDLFGSAINGIPFDPATAEFWNNNRAWNYDAVSKNNTFGVDSSHAHVQPGGVYHYHGIPNGLIEKTGKNGKTEMILLGYGADGFPIYAPYGYSKADDAKSKLKPLHSSYRLKEGNRPGGTQGPGGTYDGTFSADWEYVEGAGDLDECNGRTGVTPEYPKGTYYYVLTEEFPAVPRKLHGNPDPLFNANKPRPGNGMGPGGPMGQGGPGFGPPPPGFGPPPPGFGPPPPGFGPPPGFEPPPGFRPPG